MGEIALIHTTCPDWGVEFLGRKKIFLPLLCSKRKCRMNVASDSSKINTRSILEGL